MALLPRWPHQFKFWVYQTLTWYIIISYVYQLYQVIKIFKVKNLFHLVNRIFFFTDHLWKNIISVDFIKSYIFSYAPGVILDIITCSLLFKSIHDVEIMTENSYNKMG